MNESTELKESTESLRRTVEALRQKVREDEQKNASAGNGAADASRLEESKKMLEFGEAMLANLDQLTGFVSEARALGSKLMSEVGELRNRLANDEEDDSGEECTETDDSSIDVSIHMEI